MRKDERTNIVLTSIKDEEEKRYRQNDMEREEKVIKVFSLSFE